MIVSSFVSILTTRADGTVVVPGNFQAWPTVEDLKESETTVQAIPV
jgi:hypothetical protein